MARAGNPAGSGAVRRLAAGIRMPLRVVRAARRSGLPSQAADHLAQRRDTPASTQAGFAAGMSGLFRTAAPPPTIARDLVVADALPRRVGEVGRPGRSSQRHRARRHAVRAVTGRCRSTGRPLCLGPVRGEKSGTVGYGPGSSRRTRRATAEPREEQRRRDAADPQTNRSKRLIQDAGSLSPLRARRFAKPARLRRWVRTMGSPRARRMPRPLL